MANYPQLEERRAELVLGLETSRVGPEFPMPACACGAPAKFASYLKNGNGYYCVEHLPADLREMIANSPLYAGQDPFA
jgi:hypothetical protein